MRRTKRTILQVVTNDGALPSEFRIFSAGKNETTKGTFIFDATAAKNVMAEYDAHGIDLMLDYDHASLGMAIDPAQSGKAAGWFNLEVRNGELWATNVRFTPSAAEALKAGEWRFFSPAFQADETGRVLSVLNVAITNMPATRRLEPLMAASIRALGANSMTVEEFLKVLKALGIDPTTPLTDAIAKIQGKDTAGDSSSDKPDPADGGDSGAAPVAAAAPPPPAKDDKDPKPAEVAAALSAITSLSGKSFVASVADIRTWHASHLSRETDIAALAQREAVLESAERRKLCVELVTLAHRAPATVWSDDKSTAPKKYLAAMSIVDFREYVADAIKSSAGKSAPKVPVSGGTGAEAQLTPEQLKICKDTGCDPAVFAQLSAQRDSVKTTGGV